MHIILNMMLLACITAGLVQPASARDMTIVSKGASRSSLGPAAKAATQASMATVSPMQSTSMDTMSLSSSAPHYSIRSKLEVRQLSGDFETWGTEKTVYYPENLFLRWANPITASTYTWEVADGPFASGQILASGTNAVLQPNSASSRVFFWIDLDGIVPASPPNSPKSYFIRVVPEGKAPSTEVEITYMQDLSDTQFTSLGLDPNMLNPLRIFVDLDQLYIDKADEEDDEEPYLINMVLYLDGTMIDVFDLANSSIRLQASQGTHGNVPQYNGNLGSGDTAYLPKSTGYFQTTIRPINPELADVNLFGTVIDAAQLTRAATVIVVSIAIEEDATSTDAANALRSALLGALESRLNEVLRSLTLADLLPLLTGGGNPLDLVPNENQEICDALETHDLSNLDLLIDCRPGWEIMVDEIVDFAVDIAIIAELSDYNLFENLASAIDSDDFIGVGIATFNMEQLRTASNPIDLEFRFEKNNQAINEAGTHFVCYRVSGEVGRCKETNEADPCTPYYAPFMWQGQLIIP